ncbi:Acyltransferase [Rubripirellula obstinata]|uniref:Acyltransferase n=1 Tax=Rubripirellula obstinata TaxID=406547 RepID=A0A5B1CIZ4_9BACT|nr:1-acyl-sn-glycerol-3-phosphate acyltransferase [Rubripirellula obstinata]KAA1259699.1 Acyltransferase [Rubripirellula obstinata]
MHSVVIDQPYQFVPPYHGRLWPSALQRLIRRQLRREYGIESLHFENLDRLRDSMSAGHSVLLAPNHCRPTDPAIVNELCRQVGVVPFTMASWHIFMQSKWQRFLLRRLGAFSVYREGLDRQSLQAAIDILQAGKRPLVVFPEGVITRTNDRLIAMMEGVSFIARSAAKKRAAKKDSSTNQTSSSGGKVVVHPIAIRYHFHGDIEEAIHQTLDQIEQRLSWQPRRDADIRDRIRRVGETLLGLKEMEYFGEVHQGEIAPRVANLLDGILLPLEREWLGEPGEGNVVARVKRLRTEILQDMINGDIDETERSRRWRHLADMYIAQQISHYPPDYIRSDPTPERLLETIERFEEDLTDQCRIHRPMSATIQVGEAIEVSPKRTRGSDEDPVMTAVNRQMHEMLEIEFPAAVEVNMPMANSDG